MDNKKNNKFNFVDNIEDLANDESISKGNKNNAKKEINNKTKTKRGLYLSFESRILLMLLAIIIIFFGACYLILQAFNFGKKENITYSEVADTSYSVCLIEDSYYSSGCLASGMEYLESLTNKITVNYTYNVNISSDIDYDINYHVITDLKIYDKSTKNVLYENEDILVEETPINGSGKKINLEDDVLIDYKTYDNYVTSYKTNYSLDATATLDVLLYIDDDTESRVVSTVTIPLGEQTFSIKTDDIRSENNIVTLDNNTWSNYNSVCAFTGAFLSLLCLMLIVKLTNFVVKSFGKKTKYEETLKNILREYDEMIVVSKDGYQVPINKNIVKVDSFKELIDAKENLNKPIIYSRVNNVKSEFIVEDESTIYKYVMKDADFIE